MKTIFTTFSKKIMLTFAIGTLLLGNLYSQGTLMPIGPQSGTFTSNVRGYYFTAPVNFTICGLYIPTNASSGAQSVEVVRFTAGPPPAYAATTNNFTSLFYLANFAPNTIIPCNIPVNAGDIIGIYGARATNMVNSYDGVQYVSNILGNPVTLYRSGMQANLSTQQMANIWNENNGSIGRIEMYYNCCTGSTAADSASATPSSILCGDTTNLHVNGGSLEPGADWHWYTGSCGGTPVAVGDTITVSPTTTTTYYVRAEGSCNNSTCVAVTVTVTPTVDASWNASDTICEASGNINLNNLITGTTGGSWSGNGVTGNTFDPTFGTQAITYTVGTVPCQENLTQTLYVNPDVNPNWNAPDTICEAAGSINLDNLVTGTTGGTWSGTGVSGNMFNPSAGTQTITYTVGSSPCLETESHTIQVIQNVDPSWSNPMYLCVSNGIIDLNNFVTGTTGGTWSGTGVNGNLFNPSGFGGTMVSLTYTVGNGMCAETQTNSVLIREVVAQFTANPSSGSTPLVVNFTNNSSGASSYWWDFNNGNNDSISNPTQTFDTEGNYVVTLVATDGFCSDTTTLTIEVLDESSLIIPNVFTPNGDGKNDFFTVDGINIATINVEIYNRWGLNIYSWDNLDGKWNGKNSSGSEVPSGTYYYIIKATGKDKKEYLKKGTITLLK